MTAVPYFRPALGEDEIAAVTACLRSGWLTSGPEVAAFEAEFAAALGGGVQAVAVNSASAALHLALEALGLGPGDEVILPTLTFTATAEAVRHLGAVPVLVDIDADTLCLDPGAVAAAVTPRSRAILPVHFAGRPCDMAALADLARSQGLMLVVDAAHAFPAHLQGCPVGQGAAQATAFSFYANKTLTTGEGGMLVTSDAALAARACRMRLHGIERRAQAAGAPPGWAYEVIAPGYKYNLTDIAAAIGRVQLRRAQALADRRAQLAARYDATLADLPVILPPRAAPGDGHAWHLYVLQIRPEAPLDRDALYAALSAQGIGLSVHYRPLHQLRAWSGLAGPQGYPQAERYFARCLSLPLFPDLTEADQDRVIAALRHLLGGAA